MLQYEQSRFGALISFSIAITMTHRYQPLEYVQDRCILISTPFSVLISFIILHFNFDRTTHMF